MRAPRRSNPGRLGSRVYRSTPELEEPVAGGEGRTLKGVSPPGSEPSASSISATPAWWTQPGSNRHASRCKRGALPLVLWAQGPGGSNRTTAGAMPRGLQPRSSSQQRSPGRDRSVWRHRIDMAPIPNLAYYLVVNVRWFIRRFRQKGQSFAQQGWQESNPRPPGWSRLSVPLDYTPSSVPIQLSVWPRNTKEPPPFGSGSSTNWTYVSPSYAVEGTSWGSVATQLKDWAFNIWAMPRPRDVRRPLRLSDGR
jgi:hypothetical protein